MRDAIESGPTYNGEAMDAGADALGELRHSRDIARDPEAQRQRLDDVLELSAAFQAIVHETADHREAVAALIDRREPSYTGD